MDKKTPLQCLSFLKKGLFKIKTFTEAQDLAECLSSLCENSTLTQIALFELFSNGIEHGNLGITSSEKEKLQKEGEWLNEIDRRLSLPENQSKYLTVELRRHPTEFEVTVRDQGTGFHWKQYEDNQNNEDNQNVQTESHGRGILMAKKIAFSKLQYNEAGNQVTVLIPLNVSA